MKKYKIEIEDMIGIGVTLVVVGIVLAFGLEILGDTRDDIGITSCAGRTDGYTTYVEATRLCTNGSDSLAPTTADFNASSDAITGVAKLPNKLPLIATVIVAVIVIGILVKFFRA